MAQLKNSSGKILVPHLKIASSFFARAKGLLGTADLPQGAGIFIDKCNAIHTFFMAYSIDCIFVDRQFNVLKVKSNVRPFWMTIPVLGARSVIELGAGEAMRLGIQEGDQLYVVN